MSIPQRNKNLQALSISSLALYASMPAFFVVVAPPAYHEDLRRECNQETYQRRGWCRLEQWARITVGGMEDLLIWDGTELSQVVAPALRVPPSLGNSPLPLLSSHCE